MKNDIHYLSECQRVSSLYDSLTGFYNLGKFRNILEETEKNCFLCAVKMNFIKDGEYLYGENYRSDIVSLAAKTIKQVCSEYEIPCRSDENTIIILGKADKTRFAEKLRIMLHNCLNVKFDERQVVISTVFSDGKSLEKLRSDIKSQVECDMQGLAERQSTDRYDKLLSIRQSVMAKPEKAPSLSEASRSLCVSEGYFRSIYKKCFGISYNRECINARIIKACGLLCTTAVSVFAIAQACGYADEKFFARQFKQTTGYSPI